MDEARIDKTPGDGGDGKISEPMLAKIREEMENIVQQAKTYLWPTRLDSEDTRMARWSGQSSDGLKHEEDMDEAPEPFEGASDLRIRLADMLTNEEMMLCVVSAMRAQVIFKGVEASDAQKAANFAVVLRWVLRNQLGIRWLEELCKAAQYYSGDAPGLAFMKVWWRMERSLKMERLTVERLMALYVDMVRSRMEESEAGDAETVLAQAQEAASSFMTALTDRVYGEAQLTGLLLEFFPDLRPARAAKVIKQLRLKGAAEFPTPYLKHNGVAVQAKRLMENFWLPLNAGDFQELRMWFETEWLSEPKLRERQTSMGYSKTWVDKVLEGQEGAAAFPDYVKDKDGNIVARSSDYYAGLYNVVTCYFEAVNDDGVPGKYYVTLHSEVDGVAHDRRLIDYSHGKYPGHLMRREILSDRVCDSRGIPELAGAHQGLTKLLADSFGDHAQIAGVPPIITHGRQREGALRIRPLQELQAKRDGDYKWLSPPTYPLTLTNMLKELRRQVDEYFGRTNPEVGADVTNLSKEFRVLMFLANIREILTQVWELCQQFMTDDQLRRITNTQGEQVAQTAEDIQGKYDLELVFDPQDFDREKLAETAKTIKELLMGMDREKAIDPTPIVASLLYRLSPDMAEMALRPVDRARADELRDEKQKYLEIRSGMEPDLPDDGSLNYELRRAFYDQLVEANPQVFADLPDDKAAILESRLQRLRTLADQYGENVEIGRQGGRAALGATSQPGGGGGGEA